MTRDFAFLAAFCAAEPLFLENGEWGCLVWLIRRMVREALEMDGLHTVKVGLATGERTVGYG